MKRMIISQLRAWRESKRRKPLILRGARQVGKTWILREFGKEFPDGCAYFNFEKEEEFRQFFLGTKDVFRILKNLSMASGQKITKDSLIVFDEIQACPEALNSLKYFYEDAPEFFVASAGSLLGLELSQGFPVGKVDFLDMGPMTFSEFLMAGGDDRLVDYMTQISSLENLPDAFAKPLEEKLKMYFVTGGMPEAVLTWTEDGDAKEVDRVLTDILDAYESDFGKHAPGSEVPKIRAIWSSLPSQLSRENKKFLYSVVRGSARAREYEDALNWLHQADLIKKVYRISKPGLPLSAYEDLDAFKIYMADVGLLRRHSHLATSAFAEENRLFTEFRGALTENFVLQSLLRTFEGHPRYWADSRYEVDFIIQRENDVIPVEVKAGTNVTASSLKHYSEEFSSQTILKVRFSLRNLALDGKVLNIPLYLIDQSNRLIDLAIAFLGK